MKLTLGEIAEAVGGILKGDGQKTILGVSTDSRKIAAGDLFVALRGERFDGHDFIESVRGKCAAVITEEEVNGMDAILVKDTLKALGALAAFWKMQVAPRFTVGVTGSVGKTTTKELIACVLKEKYKTHFTTGNFNNHIGVPITLIRIEEGSEAVVCEMGMNAKGEIKYLTDLVRPNLAVITNIGTAHIENLGSREGILDAKLEILEGMEKGSTLILDGDEPLFRTPAAQEKMRGFRVIYVGFQPRCDIYPLDIYKGAENISFDVISTETEFRLTVPAVGDHFIKNALFAAAVGLACGVEESAIQNGILSYSPSGLRQKIYDKNGVRVIADCYNASPESMEAALNVLKNATGRKIAVLGDMLELGFLAPAAHKKVGALAASCGADELFSFGKESYNIMLGAVEAGMAKDKAHHTMDKSALADMIRAAVRPGDTVLFKASRRMRFEDVISDIDLTEEKA